MNEQGNSTFIMILFLLMISIAGSGLISQHISIIKKERNRYLLALCSKELNGLTGQLIKDINKTNRIIKLISMGQWASIIIPGFNIKTKVMAQKIKKAIAKKQIIDSQIYRKNIFQLQKKGCSFSLNTAMTPYKVYLTQATRDSFFQLVRRSQKEWKIIHFNQDQLIKTSFTLEGKSVSRGRRDQLFY